MKTTSPSHCRLLAALAVLSFSGFVSARPPVSPILAQAFSSVQERGEPPAQLASYAAEMNTVAYVEVIVIPLLLFILMVGVVRHHKV